MTIETYKSFYTKSNQIDLSTNLESQSSELLLKDKALHHQVEHLVTDPLFRNFVDHPLRDFGTKANLSAKGWQPLSPTAFGHQQLPGWIIKTNYADGENNKRVGNTQAGKFDNLQRPIMGHVLRRAAQEAALDMVVPEEHLVRAPNPVGKDLRNRFFVISQKLDLEENHLSGWKELYTQGILRETVKKVCRWILLSGFADASLENLRFLRQAPDHAKKLAAVDSEGIGLLKEPSEANEPSAALRHAQCGLNGLDQFTRSWERELFSEANEAATAADAKGGDYNAVYQARKGESQPLLTIVQEEVAAAKRDFDKVCTQETLKRIHPFSRTLNWPLIVASVIIPLIPLILLFAALISSWLKTPAVRQQR
jgi:hypothetical protein